MKTLRFTESKIPEELMKALGLLSEKLLGYDHTDKGYLLNLTNQISTQFLAEKLDVESYQIDLYGADDWDGEGVLYHVRTEWN